MIELSAIHLTGADASTFIQGQITADINQLNFIEQTAENTGLGALCTHQGRVVVVMWIIRHAEDDIVLLMPSDMAEQIKAHLTKFVFISKVKIELREALADELATLPEDLLIPWITQATTEKFVPHMLSLDKLNGIHFKKGCYTGQEVVARMEYLGAPKRRLAKITASNAKELAYGAEILNDEDKSAGTIIYFEGDNALAVIQLSAKESALKLNEPITIEHIWE